MRVTIRDVVLRAIHSGAHLDVLTREWIVVQAWTDNTNRLGLRGYENQFPDSNRVTVELVRLVRDGLVRRPRPGQYALTEAGLSRCELIGGAA